MARPSQNLDRKMIELGKEKTVTMGLSNLSVRQICLDAGINLGMFYYYFKSKENYIRAIFSSLNEDMKNNCIKQAEKSSNSKERLKKILLLNAKMAKESKGMIETIIKGTDIFDKLYVEIGKEFHESWMKFYISLVDACKNDGYFNKETGSEELVAIFLGTLHHYSKICEHHIMDSEQHYKKIEDMMDFLMEKFK